MQLLLDHQAAVDSIDEGGWTPLHKAVAGSNEFTNDHGSVIDMLLGAGAKVNDVGGAHGQTALHLAARDGLVQVRDLHGKTPCRACRGGGGDGNAFLLNFFASQGGVLFCASFADFFCGIFFASFLPSVCFYCGNPWTSFVSHAPF